MSNGRQTVKLLLLALEDNGLTGHIPRSGMVGRAVSGSMS
jgi:hypothetical protein